MVRERGQIGGVLADKPVQELLEGLSRELPEEDERVRLAEATLEPIEDGRLGGVVELLLQDGGPDPGAGEQQNDGSDSGIITVFNFSSPVSKISMGPIENFRLLVRDPMYKPMLNFKTFKKGNMVITGKSAYQLVVLTTQDNEKAAYLFMLARQTKGYYKGCWMTVGVVRMENDRPTFGA